LASPHPTRKGADAFTGTSVTDLSRYVLRRMFVELDATFASKPPEEQERIAADLARQLADLPQHVRERIQ